MFVYLLIFVLLLCLIHILFNYNERARMLRQIPGPKYAFIVGNGLEVIASADDLMIIGRQWAEKWKGIYRIWSYPIGAVVIYNPEDIETVISTVKYNDKSNIYDNLSPWLQQGLLLSKGEKWHQRRKLLTPAFHFNILRQFTVVLQENSQRRVETLQKSAGESVDIGPVLSEFTLQSICETAMGTQLNKTTTVSGMSYKKAIFDIGNIFVYRAIRFYLFFDSIFNLTSSCKQMKTYLKVIHNFTRGVIEARREHVRKYGVFLPEDSGEEDEVVYKHKRKTAMLDLLLLAEKDGLIDAAGIQEEVDTFMFEGHDTTASGLTFCLMSLANSRDIQDKIHHELQEIFGESTRPASMEDLTKMKYLECCIKESLRFYPPVNFISRFLQEPATLSGYTVPANTICHISTLDLHRSPHLYKEPLEFDPERFLPENSAGRHPYAYIPFSAGPRNCIGQKFAMMEMKHAISEILRKFILLPVTRHEDIRFTAHLVLKSGSPIYVTFVKR